MDYEDKVFIVTGASSGIGAAVMRQLLFSGAKVIGVVRQTSKEKLALDNKQIKNFEPVVCDLSDMGKIGDTLAPALNNIPNLAGVILCHGYGDFGSLEELSVSRIQRQIDTNFTSTILVSRLVIPLLKKNKCGDLVIIGSESALKGGKKGAVYSATKFGLRGFVQALRQECASSGVRVAIVNPGMVDTPFFDDLDFRPGEAQGNSIQADEVADVVKSIIDMPVGTVIDEVNLSPQTTVIRNKPK